MKGVMTEVPPHLLAWRRRTGAAAFDEMWEGVLHMTPSPSRTHQSLVLEMAMWLNRYWAEPNDCRVYHQLNVAERGAWPDNYRIPDLVLLTPERFAIDRDLYLDGGPDVVVEVRSPDDETYEKLAFYAQIGVREAWVVDRDTKRPEMYELRDGELRAVAADGEGWLSSRATGVQLRVSPEGKLRLRAGERPDSTSDLG